MTTGNDWTAGPRLAADLKQRMKSLHDYEEDRAEAGSRAGRTGTTAPSSGESSASNDPSSSSAED